MMKVADLRITNFRGIKSAHIKFGAHTLLVGPNNCGKTTVVEALAQLFGRDRMIRALTEHDFYGSNPEPADRILLIATVIGFEGDDPANHSSWFREDRAIVKWWNPDVGCIAPTRDQPHWQLACQVAFCARFDAPSLEVETARYFYDDDGTDVFTDHLWTPVPQSLIRDLGFFFVPASRTWDRVISFSSELFRRVVASGAGKPAVSVITERDRLRAPEHPLELDEHLAPIVTQLNKELAGFFHTKPTLHLRVTSTDSDGLLEAVMPHYGHAHNELGLPAKRHGSGLLSLQHLLLLLQFGKQRAEAHEGFWMALEEPELHVPPPLRHLVHRIQALSTQTFVSTHSPVVASIADPTSITILRNDAGTLTSTQLLQSALPPQTPNGVRKLFQLNRTDTISAIMHDAVLVPEGRIDFDWLRLLARAVDINQGWNQDSRFDCYVGLIPTHDAAVVSTVDVLHSLNPRIAALVDGDAPGVGYATALAAAAKKPLAILRWPDAWTVEDVIGWILEADVAALNSPAITQSIAPTPATIADLVGRLKSEDRNAGGLKQDKIAYEGIAAAIGENEQCCSRTRILLNAIADEALGQQTQLFAANGQPPPIRTFNP